MFSLSKNFSAVLASRGNSNKVHKQLKRVRLSIRKLTNKHVLHKTHE